MIQQQPMGYYGVTMFSTNFDTTPQNENQFTYTFPLKLKTNNLKSKYQFSIIILSFISKILENQIFESIATKIFYGP
jgi:hypothetical protein